MLIQHIILFTISSYSNFYWEWLSGTLWPHLESTLGLFGQSPSVTLDQSTYAPQFTDAHGERRSENHQVLIQNLNIRCSIVSGMWIPFGSREWLLSLGRVVAFSLSIIRSESRIIFYSLRFTCWLKWVPIHRYYFRSERREAVEVAEELVSHLVFGSQHLASLTVQMNRMIQRCRMVRSH